MMTWDDIMFTFFTNYANRGGFDYKILFDQMNRANGERSGQRRPTRPVPIHTYTIDGIVHEVYEAGVY